MPASSNHLPAPTPAQQRTWPKSWRLVFTNFEGETSPLSAILATAARVDPAWRKHRSRLERCRSSVGWAVVKTNNKKLDRSPGQVVPCLMQNSRLDKAALVAHVSKAFETARDPVRPTWKAHSAQDCGFGGWWRKSEKQLNTKKKREKNKIQRKNYQPDYHRFTVIHRTRQPDYH